MEEDDGEPDDWPVPTHAAMAELDTSLRCGSCRGLLCVPLRHPACPHAFCSACFRAWQAGRGEVACPTCREVLDVMQLRPDPVLHAVADAFRRARPALLALALAPQPPPPAPAPRATRASRRGCGRGGEAAPALPEDDVECLSLAEDSSEAEGEEEDSDFVQHTAAAPRAAAKSSSAVGNEACFMCGAFVKSEFLQQHVNDCIDKQQVAENKQRAADGRRRAAEASNGAARLASALGHPPTMALHLMGLHKLGELCAEWGLLEKQETAKKVGEKQLKARWSRFYTLAKTQKDKAALGDVGQPDYAAVAWQVMRDESRARRAGREDNRTGFFSGGGGGGGGREAPVGDPHTYVKLQAEVEARGRAGRPRPRGSVGAREGEGLEGEGAHPEDGGLSRKRGRLQSPPERLADN